MTSPILLTTAIVLSTLSLPVVSAAKEQDSTKSGGLEAPPVKCFQSYSAKEHKSWSKKHLNSKNIPKKAHRRHTLYVNCAISENDVTKMIRFWKKVKKSVLPKNHDLWVRIGRCEQPGPGYKGVYWSHPGPTYQGGLGFWHGTWDSFKYPGMPNDAGQATWRQQMKVANNLLRQYGTSPWGCT